MRRAATVLFVLACLASLPTPGEAKPRTAKQPAAKPPGQLAARSPAGVVHTLGSIYSERNLGSLDRLLTADFRFHFSSGDPAGSRYAEGWTRDLELKSASAMFFGAESARIAERPDSITFVLGEIVEGADPEHPDSTGHYRLVVARDMGLRLVLPHHKVVFVRGMQVFHAVRGDAALCTHEQPADSTRWFLRRWVEDLDEVTAALAGVDGACGGEAEAHAVAPAVPVRLAVRAVGAPLCPTLKLLCELPAGGPATLEVYDVAGRRLSERTLPAHAAGVIATEAGGGMRFTPGAYWVRLSQTGGPAVTRMVLVAK